jgi:ABC-type branched-subunit amino acid transport system ATPase component
VTGLIGPNGAGKTTLFNACSGYVRPASGTVTLDGDDLTSHSPVHRARAGLGRTFQRMELFGSMTVFGNVALAVESRDIAGDDPTVLLGLRKRGRRLRERVAARTDELLDRCGLAHVRDRRVSDLPNGLARVVELARAMAREPTVLLLDEPSSGLDTGETRQFGALLRGYVDDGTAGILLVEHDMRLVMEVCDWIEVLDHGQPLFAGDPDAVRASTDVRRAYLGQEIR